jgi:transcriptional regulator with XRE-family HTH domain
MQDPCPDDDVLSPIEKLVYRLRRKDKLTQAAIGDRLNLSQGTVSRLLQSASAKAERLTAACVEAGGDPQAVADYLGRDDAAHNPSGRSPA